jgi:hypothetical protein
LRARFGFVTLLLVVPPAALGLLAAGPALASGPEDDSNVVIAVVDTGVNPYHRAFLDAARTADPAGYITGYPAGAKPLALCLDSVAHPDCATLEGALQHDAGVWASIEPTTPRALGWGPLYYLPGTRIIGAVSVGSPDDGFTGTARIFDDHGHGTATASLAAGDAPPGPGLPAMQGLCPRCLLVIVEGPGDTALAWARDQPWIDVVTNSWGLTANLDFPPPPFGTSYALLTKAMVQGDPANRVVGGKTVLFSAGNGLGVDAPDPLWRVTTAPDYVAPGESTYTSEYTGPDWVVTVGATDPQNGQPIAGSGRPVDVAAAGLDVPAADATSRSGVVSFSGTSASAPIAAGVFAGVLLELRRALGDRAEGPRPDEVLGVGLPRACVSSGCPLGDGVLTRDELQRLVYTAAAPCPLAVGATCPWSEEQWPFPARSWGWTAPQPPYAYPATVGFGSVDARTRDAAVQAGLGERPVPARTDADAWAKSDSIVRQRLWGAWNHGSKAQDLVPPGLVH